MQTLRLMITIVLSTFILTSTSHAKPNRQTAVGYVGGSKSSVKKIVNTKKNKRLSKGTTSSAYKSASNSRSANKIASKPSSTNTVKYSSSAPTVENASFGRGLPLNQTSNFYDPNNRISLIPGASATPHDCPFKKTVSPSQRSVASKAQVKTGYASGSALENTSFGYTK